jgi:hypothetical protein
MAIGFSATGASRVFPLEVYRAPREHILERKVDR